MRKTVRWVLLSLVAPLALAACTTPYDCQDVQAYMFAQQYPALKSPPGLQVPSPDPEMVIPEVKNGPVRTYDNPPRDTTDNVFAKCLVSPPLMSDEG